MVKFLTTTNTAAKIEKIIIKAKKEITLITPYIKLTQTFYDRLKEADNRNVDIRLIYGKKDLHPKDLTKIKKLNHLGLYFSKDLHAKCYFNEDLMVITSMNFHEFSQTHNREMGVQIKREDENDKELFQNAKEEAELIIKNSIPKISRLSSKIRDEKIDPKITLNTEEQRLFKRLKSFRYTTSEKENVAAYMVFKDKVLENFAKQQPKTKKELLAIKGVAIKKYEKYGEEVLKIIREFKI